MDQKSDDQYRNLNITSNAIELVACMVKELNSDDVRKSIDGKQVSEGVLKEAIASRLQRRLKSHQY